jgi:hypothetical protein
MSVITKVPGHNQSNGGSRWNREFGRKPECQRAQVAAIRFASGFLTFTIRAQNLTKKTHHSISLVFVTFAVHRH